MESGASALYVSRSRFLHIAPNARPFSWLSPGARPLMRGARFSSIDPMKKSIAFLASFAFAFSALHADDAKPLKVLLLTGGCCHDYKAQKDILKKGIEERINAEVTQVHTDDSSTKPPLAFLGNPDYAKGYDVVIHDECAADIKDPALIQGVLKPHQDGIPGVNLHCAMHCYRFGDFGKPVPAGAENSHWYEYLGLQSTGHGAQLPITVKVLDEKNPITASIIGWVTGKEELYNNIQILTGKALARGAQGAGDKPGQNDTVVVWTNEYGTKKTKVFSTTLGHNNTTVSDPKYLDLVAHGILFVTDKMTPDGKPIKGYEPKAH
jgi:hypothetical protein